MQALSMLVDKRACRLVLLSVVEFYDDYFSEQSSQKASSSDAGQIRSERARSSLHLLLDSQVLAQAELQNHFDWSIRLNNFT